jgi:aminoglycoside phosphotransferase (APT) family kinase protein
VEERAGYFRVLGNLLREVHSAPAPAKLRGQQPWIDRMLLTARKNLSWSEGSADLLARLEASRPPLRPEVVIHGDLALDNVLVDERARMAIIDWSGGGLGDARYDVALALNTEPELRLRDEERAAFFEGYGATPLDSSTMRWFVNLYEFF